MPSALHKARVSRTRTSRQHLNEADLCLANPQITHNQYIQAHTILKKDVHRFADEPVLVLGGKLDTVRKVAERYE